MTPTRAQTLVVTTMAISGGLLVVRAAAEDKKPTTRQVVGIAVAGVGLSAMATVASPDLAGGLALLWLTSSVFIYGGPAVRALSTPLKK